jgi:hypothetical protein
VIGGGHLVKPLAVIEEHLGLPVKNWCDVAFHDVSQERQQFVSNPIPAIARVEIGGVGAGNDAGVDNEGVEIAAAKVTKWFGYVIVHRGQSGQSGTTEEIQKNGFGHVVQGVSGEGSSRQGGPTSAPSALLKIRTRFHHDVMTDEPEPTGRAKVTDEIGVTSRFKSSVMVNVVHRHVESRLEGEEEKPG